MNPTVGVQLAILVSILMVLGYMARIHKMLVLFSAEHEVLMLDFYERHPDIPRPMHYGGPRSGKKVCKAYREV